MIVPEHLAKIVAHAKRHEDEGFLDNDVSVLLKEREQLKSMLEFIRDHCASAPVEEDSLAYIHDLCVRGLS